MRDEGDVPFAIRASCAIPGWYVPVMDGQGRQLVDGGLVALIPVAAARALGAEIVIAVDVNAEGATFLGPSRSTIGIMLQSVLTLFNNSFPGATARGGCGDQSTDRTYSLGSVVSR